MLPKQKNINQMVLYSTFEVQLNPNYPLYKLCLLIRWHFLDVAFFKHIKSPAIGPVIGYPKSYYKMNSNFLKGVIGNEIN